ncbi:hypothetical protein HXX76_004407 [Chlamydomonas incerta]|uniref:Uncharacterized protein n=1 Tax=Chlamydomonas incerta TaxID=51695 RepID=A0A835TA50_CHLIN|nr:hypothetical protein HXX76_004407 [Chlamydomonas incerta]|eukprot:KAG2440296.1 hypothetical protein HXX76_004407 [Chlamydomonas incerta]
MNLLSLTNDANEPDRRLSVLSLLGALTGLMVLFSCLKRLHPLMVRLHKQDGGLVNTKSRLVRAGTSWTTAYLLFRLPTGAAAALCACRAAVDLGSISLVLSGAQQHEWVQPTLGMLVVVMVLAVGILSYLDDVAFVVTVWLWLMGLIVATHTLLMTKCFCIALVLGLAMRAAFKYVPDDDMEVQSKKQ